MRTVFRCVASRNNRADGGGVSLSSSTEQGRFDYPRQPNSLSALRNPGTFYFGTASNDWTSPQNADLWRDDAKMLFDPCPAGWRVPKGGKNDELRNPWRYFSLTNSTWNDTDPAKGRYWNTTVVHSVPAWLPVTGYRHWITSRLEMCGVEISLWTTTREDTKNYYLFSNSSTVNPGGYQGGYSVSAIGFPVRCVRE